MSTGPMELERVTLEHLRTDFEAKGYRFVLQPTKDEIPDFLGSYRPDAVAFGDRDRVIIEVKGRETRRNKIPLAEVARRVPQGSGWRYLLVYAGQDSSEVVDIPRPSKRQVDQAIKEARELMETGHNRAAMLELWSILEALTRRIYSDNILVSLKPLSPAQIVERLAMDGELDREEARRLKSLISLRNSVAHGDLEAKVSRENVSHILSLIDTINSRVASD